MALVQIFKSLDPRERAIAACVCKEWRTASNEHCLWESLNLQGRQYAAKYLEKLPRMNQFKGVLQDVNLEFAAGVEGKHIELLIGFDLRTLNLNACQKVKEASLLKLLPTLGNLQSLSLYWNLNVTDASLFVLATNCTNLAQLNLSGCKLITDAGLTNVVTACPNLTDLDLTRCLAVTDAGLSAVGEHCPKLRQLRLYALATLGDAALVAFGALSCLELIDLTGAHLITDAGLQALAACHALESVSLSWCVTLTDAGVTALAAGCRRLALLSLHGNVHVSNATLDALQRHCASSLHTLDVQGCISMSDRGREPLRRRFPKLTCFVVHK